MERTTSRRQQGGTGETQFYWPKVERGYRCPSREKERGRKDVTEWGWSTERVSREVWTIENGSFFVFNSPYNHEGRQTGKQRPLQSQKSTAGLAVGLVNSTYLLFMSLHYIKHRQTQTAKLSCSASILSHFSFLEGRYRKISSVALCAIIAYRRNYN